MSRRARHKAPKGCCDHLHDLATAQADIKLMSRLIEKVNAEKDALRRQVRSLRAELTGEAITEELSLAQIRAQMRRTAPFSVKVIIPNGPTMMLPVGTTRARRAHRPSWAIRD